MANAIARYLADHAATLAIITLRQRLVALSRWHTDQGFPDPTKSALVRKVLKGSLRFVIKEAGDFTETIPTWRAGALGYVDGPYGDFQIPAEAQAVVMVAGASVSARSWVCWLPARRKATRAPSV